MRWPSGEVTALIPSGKDRFMDRAYWVEVVLERDAQGRVVGMAYDGMKGTKAQGEEAR